MFLQLDGTFWIQIVNFFIFFAILNVVYIKPAAAALQRRREYIDSVQNDLENAQHQARELLGQAEERRLEAHREATRGANEIVADAVREAERIALRAQEQATALVDEAHQAVEGEMEVARSQEEALVSDLARTMLARTVGSL